MIHSRRAIVCVLLVWIGAVGGCSDSPDVIVEPTPEQALIRGVDWLLLQQATDGGWHSATYGPMRGGAGNTGLVLYALSQLSPEIRSKLPAQTQCKLSSAIQRGQRFLLRQQDKLGFARGEDGLTDFPTYASAVLLLSMKPEPAQLSAEQKQLAAYLRAVQQTAAQGWKTSDLDYGGWNQTGGDETDAIMAGKTNISVSSFALEALATAGLLDEATRKAALLYLSRCQNFDGQEADGGFYFSPVADNPLNKAGMITLPDGSTRNRSYGTTTADGIVALLVCGEAADSPRVAAALSWLEQHYDPTTLRAPGFPDDPASLALSNGLRFYYAASLARVMRHLPKAKLNQHRSNLTQLLVTMQRPDGSWQNEHTMMREDDPLIATSLAVSALGQATSESKTGTKQD
ncbi:MAG: prenyltransferase/squalene oxidase repeat-containing protein [Planctomycetota bacterium]|nr:prenyltransferase/squalene oxidase repeat-containing protein [Planctomycetota bacterium]